MLNVAPDAAAIRAAVLCVFNYSADWIRPSLTLTRHPHLIGCYRPNRCTHPLACDAWFVRVAFLVLNVGLSRWSSALTDKPSPRRGLETGLNQICPLFFTPHIFLSQFVIRQCVKRFGHVDPNGGECQLDLQGHIIACQLRCHSKALGSLAWLKGS